MTSGTLAEWRTGLDAGDLSPQFLGLHCHDRIDNLDGRLRAIASRDKELTFSYARVAEDRLRRGDRSPMLGIPFVLKDNLHLQNTPLGNGSRIQEGFRSAHSATVVQRLLDAGAIPVAKACMDEFAMGSSGEFCASGPASNPWDPERVPGGSSSGSIVSVAAGYAPFALGSDTGGSVRLPGSFCNVTALRPTYGALSRSGLTAMASSLDQVGPVAASARDLAMGLSTMTGRDPLDSTSVDLPGAERLIPLEPLPLKGLRIGLPREYFGEGIDPEVRSTLGTALERLASEGAELVEVSLPHTPYAIETYYLICTSEVSSNMSRFDGVRYGARKPSGTLNAMIAETRDQGLGAEVKRRILLGNFCLSKGYYDAFYLKALKARTLITQDFVRAFEKVDFLATPVSPTVAFQLGEKVQDPMSMYLMDVYTVTTALAAVPCMSVPAGLAAPSKGHDKPLPVGLQFIGPHLSDVRLLELAHAFQQITPHHTQRPPLPA